MSKLHISFIACMTDRLHFSARYPKGSVLSLSFHNFTKLWHHSRLRFPFFNNRHHRYAHPEKDAKKKRKGRMEEESHVGADFSRLEYGVERNLLEAPQLDLIYYADVAGVVPDGAQRYEAEGLENMDIGNGGSPPEWGIELVTYSATIHYGPWADRQRYRTFIILNRFVVLILFDSECNSNVSFFRQRSRIIHLRKTYDLVINGHPLA